MNKLIVVLVVSAFAAVASARPQTCFDFNFRDHFRQVEQILKDEVEAAIEDPDYHYAHLTDDLVIELGLNHFESDYSPKCAHEMGEKIRNFYDIEESDPNVCTTEILDVLYDSYPVIFHKESPQLYSALLNKFNMILTKCADKFKEAVPLKTNGILGKNLDTFIKNWAEGREDCQKYKNEGSGWYYHCAFDNHHHTLAHREVIANMLKETNSADLKRIYYENKPESRAEIESLVWNLFKDECVEIHPLTVNSSPFDSNYIIDGRLEDSLIKRIRKTLKFAYESSGSVPAGYDNLFLYKLDSYHNNCRFIWQKISSIGAQVQNQLNKQGEVEGFWKRS